MVPAFLLSLALCGVPSADGGVEPAPALPDRPTAGAAPCSEGLLSGSLSIDGLAFPRPPIGRLALDIGRSMVHPLSPDEREWWILGAMFTGAIATYTADVQLHAAAQRIPDPQLAGADLSYWVSYLGEGWVDVGLFLAVGLLGGRPGQRAAWAGLEALAATAIVSRIGKLALRVERPSYDSSEHHWFSRLSADAMPSGHTMAAFSTAAVLASEWPRLGPLFYALAAWVGVARVQQSTHWASDVVVGAGLGALFGLQSWQLTRRFELEVQPWAGADGGGVAVRKAF